MFMDRWASHHWYPTPLYFIGSHYLLNVVSVFQLLLFVKFLKLFFPLFGFTVTLCSLLLISYHCRDYFHVFFDLF